MYTADPMRLSNDKPAKPPNWEHVITSISGKFSWIGHSSVSLFDL